MHNAAIPIANTIAPITIIAVSPIICQNNCALLLPNTFLIPTSFERPTACAVERLMKLMQAMIIINIPIKESVHSVDLLVT